MGSADQSSAGGYFLSFVTAGVPIISLAPNGSGSQAGAILTATQTDEYRFTASTTGTMNLGVATADPTVSLIASAFNQYGSYAGSGSDFAFPVVAGKNYDIYVSSADQSSTGGYVLSLRTAATPAITLASDGSGSQAGDLLTPAQIDEYQFTAVVTGQIRYSLSPADGTASFGASVATQNGVSLGGGTAGSFFAVAGNTYDVLVNSADASSTGGYLLSLTTADVPLITLASDGSGSQSGDLLTPTQNDEYQFTATATGPLSLSLAPADGTSELNADAYVVDENGSFLGFGTAISFSAVAGSHYAVYVGSYGSSAIGGYRLALARRGRPSSHWRRTVRGASRVRSCRRRRPTNTSSLRP